MDKKMSDYMACPVCRYECCIPDGGLNSLPTNYSSSKMVEIRKRSETPLSEALCGICSEEERVKARLYCFDCDQNLCERCGITHGKIKICGDHKTVLMKDEPKPIEINFHENYCDQHPGELVHVYCRNDKAIVCMSCSAEKHQSHECMSVSKASEELSSSLKKDLKLVVRKLPEFQNSLKACEQWKKAFLALIADAEKQISDERLNLRVLATFHANALRYKLNVFKQERLKQFENMKQDLERSKIAIESYRTYSEELLSKKPGDICQGAAQLKARARELTSLTADLRAQNFNWDAVIFKSRNLMDVLRIHDIGNIVGEIQAGSTNDFFIQSDTNNAGKAKLEGISETKRNLKRQQSDFIRTDEFTKKFKQHIPDQELEVKEMEVNLCDMPDDVKRAKPYLLDKVAATVENTSDISLPVSSVFAKDEAKQELDLVRRDTSMKKLKQALPDLECDIKQTEVNLLGVPDDVKRSKVYFLGKVAASVRGTFDISEPVNIVFSEDETKPYLTEQLGGKGVSSSWMCIDRSTIVTASDCENLENEMEVLKREVVESNLDLEHAVKQKEVNLRDIPDDVKGSKPYLLDKVASTFQDTFDISETVSKVFAKDEARPYLTEQLSGKGICASWMCMDRNIAVSASDCENLKNAIEVLKNEVVEAYLGLDAVYLPENFGQSSLWKDFVTELCEEDRLLEVGISDSVIFAACKRSSIVKTKRRIEDFVFQSSMHVKDMFHRLAISSKWK